MNIDPEVMPRGSPYDGEDMPLCDKRLVVLQNKQNANADFFMQTNFKNGDDVAIPGRIVGLVSDDIYFDRDKKSIWYGEPRPLANIPIGIRDYKWRLIKTVDTSSTAPTRRCSRRPRRSTARSRRARARACTSSSSTTPATRITRTPTTTPTT